MFFWSQITIREREMEMRLLIVPIRFPPYAWTKLGLQCVLGIKQGLRLLKLDKPHIFLESRKAFGTNGEWYGLGDRIAHRINH